MPYNCLRGAYNKPRLVQGISKAPLSTPEALLKPSATNTNKTVLRYFPSLSPLCCLYFSSAFALFYMFLSLVWLSFIPLGLFLETVFHLFCLSIFTHLILFCSMSGTQRITDQIVTLVWILSGTMSTTFRRTRRRTYITMALNMSSKRRRIRGALEMP